MQLPFLFKPRVLSLGQKQPCFDNNYQLRKQILEITQYSNLDCSVCFQMGKAAEYILPSLDCSLFTCLTFEGEPRFRSLIMSFSEQNPNLPPFWMTSEHSSLRFNLASMISAFPVPWGEYWWEEKRPWQNRLNQ